MAISKQQSFAMRFFLQLHYLLIICIARITTQRVITLDGNAWTLTITARNISIPVLVPGSVHLALEQAEITGDPDYG